MAHLNRTRDLDRFGRLTDVCCHVATGSRKFASERRMGPILFTASAALCMGDIFRLTTRFFIVLYICQSKRAKRMASRGLGITRMPNCRCGLTAFISKIGKETSASCNVRSGICDKIDSPFKSLYASRMKTDEY